VRGSNHYLPELRHRYRRNLARSSRAKQSFLGTIALLTGVVACPCDAGRNKSAEYFVSNGVPAPRLPSCYEKFAALSKQPSEVRKSYGGRPKNPDCHVVH